MLKVRCYTESHGFIGTFLPLILSISTLECVSVHEPKADLMGSVAVEGSVT